MAVQPPGASALFLREAEIRRGMELMYFAQASFTRSLDAGLAEMGLGRAHHRALYFIARKPGISVTGLLRLLGITKQSLGRVLTELADRGMIDVRPGESDRRQRLLRLTPKGAAFEASLFEPTRAKMARAYAAAGQQAVTGFWAVLESLISDEDRKRLDALLAEPAPRSFSPAASTDSGRSRSS